MKSRKTFLIIFTFVSSYQMARNLHRKRDTAIPSLETTQSNIANKKYILKSSHLRPIPLKTYDQEYFNKKLLPKKLTYRNNEDVHVSGKILKELIANLLEEINLRKKSYTDFTILKQSDFNPITKNGLLIVKFKNYPFVFKLFMESAKSFSRPYKGSFQQRGLFNMGGCLRHLAGFTRIKNAEKMALKIQASPEWCDRITLPRKWFWLPEEPIWLDIKAHNLEKNDFEVLIPAIYGIVADAIDLDDKKPTEKECLKFCAYMEYILDPHVVNFLKEKNTNKIALIDTEHFPTLIGLTEKLREIDDYYVWYAEMLKHYVKINIFSFKDERRARITDAKTYYKL